MEKGTRKRKLRDRICSAVLAFSVIATMLPTMMFSASAADRTITINDSTQGNADLQQAFAEAQNGDVITVELNTNLTLSAPLKCPAGVSLTINGNGNTITAVKGGPFTGEVYMLDIGDSDESKTSSLTLNNITFNGNGGTGGVSARLCNFVGNGLIIENTYYREAGAAAGLSLWNYAKTFGGPRFTSTLTNCIFRNNIAETNNTTAGGGLYIDNGSKVTITGCTFENNKSHSGAGLYAYGDDTIVTIDSTTKFIGNQAGQRGGAIHSHATVICEGTQFARNSSGQFGGAIYVSANIDSQNRQHFGAVVLKNIKIQNHSAGSAGGAVYIADNAALFCYTGTVIKDNLITTDEAPAPYDQNNVFVQTSNSKLVAAADIVPDSIGASTGNPYTKKDLVFSTCTLEATSFPNVRQYVTGFDPNYDMSTNETNYDAFFYDSEGWTLVKDEEHPEMMYLMTTSAADTGTVIFDYNLPGDAAEVYENQAVDSTIDVPKYQNQEVDGVTFKFLGWYTDAEGGQRIGNTVTVNPGTTVYYAHWQLETSGGGGGGMGTGDMYVGYFDYNIEGAGVTSVYCAAGEFTWTVEVDGESKTYTATLPFQFPEDPYRPGYTFLGWATTSTATAPNVDKNTWLPSENQNTVYGVWEPDVHTLTWDANGGVGTTTTTQNYDEVIVPPAAEPTRDGYTFAGWYIDANCTVPLSSSATVHSDQTFYAAWTSEKVIVTYYDTRQGTTVVGTQEYNYGDVLTPLNEMEDTDGQFFIRWETEDGKEANSIGELTSAVLTYHRGSNGGDVSSDAGYWELNLYAVWQEQTTDYITTIRWNDLSNNDGCRPQSIHLGLLSSVSDRVVAEQTVATIDADEQTVTFTDLPITTADSSVEKITYKVFMIGYTDSDGTYREIKDTAATSGELIGSSASDYDDTTSTVYRYAINTYTTGAAAAEYSGTISLDHDLITTGDDVQFSIQWDDQSNNDGVRPSAVTLVLYANGLKVADHPLHNSGTGVVSVSPSNCDVSDDGNVWTYTFKDYQKYTGGQAIDYTVAVTNDDQVTTFNGNGYSTKYLNSANPAIGDAHGAIISRDIELTTKTVTVEWDDESNRDNLRPETITVTLSAYQWNNQTYRWEEVLVDTADISGGADNDTWTHEFTDLPVFHGGQRIIYRAAITSDLNAHIPEGANGYTSTSNELNIVVSHNRNVKSVTSTIEWADNQNNDQIRPSTIIVQLYADGVKLDGAQYAQLLSGDLTADTWTATFNNLPVYRDGEQGEEIVYTISAEEAVEGSLYGTYISDANGEEEEIVRYTASYMSAAGETTDDLQQSAYPYVKLTHGTDQGTVNIYASWHDDQNRDGKRPSSIQVDLYKQVGSEKTFVQTYTVTAGRDNSWTYSVSGLPLNENGQKITYLVDVNEDFRQQLEQSGYTCTMEGSTVHLYYTPAVGYVTGHINWNDNGDNDNLRPDSVTATLYANGKSTGQTLELNEDNGWTQTWQDVDSYYNDNGTTGTPVVYTIVVEVPNGYTVSYTPESTTTINPQTINIDLTHETDQQALDATIYWNDNSDQDGRRPDSVNIQLYANGEKVVGQTADVTGDGDVWTTSFSGLDKYENGEPIDYTIRLNDNTGRTYEALTAGMNLYLSYDAVVADMSVSFRFDDRNDADGVRPDALYLNLTADGVPIDEADYKRTVNFDTDGVTWNFSDLPVYSTNGTKIRYNATVELSADYGATDYTVTTSRDVELSETNSNNNQIIVTLSRSSDTGTETGHIYWFDANNQRGNRPDSLTIVVRSDASTAVVGTYTINSETGKVTDAKGSEVGSVTVSEWGSDGSSCWTYTIEGLTQNAIYDGVSNEIFYTATANTTGVTSWYTVSDGISLDIALTHKNYLDDVGSSTQDFTVTLSWLDNSNAWGYRPDTTGVDIALLANGVEYDTIHLTQTNAVSGNDASWSYVFEDLPTYLNGNAVVWTAQIEDIAKYTETTANHDDYATITMTQSIGFDFTVNWNDADDDDAARPDEVTVEIYGDGTKAGEVTLTGDGNSWTGSITDLPVWRTVGTTIPVAYSFRWSDATGSELIDNYYTATPTHDGAPVDTDSFYWISATEWGAIDGGLNDLTGQYQWETTLTRNQETRDVYADILWDDDGNRDGLRPESIAVQLLANGEPAGDPVTLTGGSTDSSWPVKWEAQNVYDGGKPIVYTVEVVTIPDGYAATSDSTGLNITLTHTPEITNVTGTVNWDDSSEAHYEYNSQGELIRSWYGIERVDVFMQLLINGEPYGDPIEIPASGYEQEDGTLAIYASYTWQDVFVHENEGESNKYTISVYSPELDALLEDGYTQTYNFEEAYKPATTIQHTYYDVRGTVWYLYNSSDEFRLADVPVTAYLYNEEEDTYTSVGSAVTDENGEYEIRNIPQGLITVRATYEYGDYTYAGSVGVQLNLCDQDNVDLIVNRDAQTDSDLYRYSASGRAYYQTDRTDDSTRTAVPAGSVVLLYKITDTAENAQYIGMTTTDESGAYSFDSLESGTYLVNVVFNYADGTYTYDNSDAQADGLTFRISGADTSWPDIVKQVNAQVEPGPDPDPGEEPDPEPELPEPCVVDGMVYFSDNGQHTTDPVEGVDVYIYAADNNALVGQAVTGADGHWSIEGIGAGNYIGVFSYAGSTSRVLHFTVTDDDFETGTYTAATQYFDRQSDVSTAMIRGVVLDETGSQTSALVQILSESGDIVDVAYTDKDGFYSFTVQSGQTYRVKIVSVDRETEYLTAGDPDDEYTTLDYYTVSGNFSIDGAAQSGATVVLYKVDGDNAAGSPVTATLTDGSGNYTLQVMEAGNYRITMYRDGQVYANHMVSVGYQEYEPIVTGSDGSYTISGSEPDGYDSGILYDISTNVVRRISEFGAGTSYRFDSLPAGTYMLELVQGGAMTRYYIDAPDTVIDVNHYITVSGSVTGSDGNPVLGAVVTLLNSDGEQVGEQTVITNGSYEYSGLPAGEYTVQIDKPVAGTELVSKTTEEPDSYGASYPGGMPDGSVWSWNMNAVTVSGTVTDQTGAPVEGATVVLKLDSDPDKAYGVTTNENGQWSMGVMDGSYTASAMFEADAEHIYHSVNDVPVTVSGNDVSGVELTINRYTVSGSVVRDGDDQPIAGADVTITYPDGTEVWTGKSGDDGSFTAPLFPDDYQVSVSYEDQAANADITVDDDMDLTLRVGIPITISGTVYDTDGQPVSDGIVYYDGPASGRVYTNEDGLYTISLTASQTGRYTLYATAAGNTSETVTVDVQTDTTQDLTLKDDGGSEPDPGSEHMITGVVVDNEGNRLANALVTVVYGDDKTKTVETSTSDNGSFRVNVPDGTFYLSAVYEAPNGYSYQTNGDSTVHVNGSDVTDIVLAVSLSYEVRVSVVDTTGAPVEGATVTYSGASTGEATTGSDGMAILQLAGGKYDFKATIGNRESGTQTVEINKATDIKLTVGTTGIEYEPPTVESHDNTISGYVVDPQGNTVAGADVTLLKWNVATEDWDVIKTTVSNGDGYYEFTGLDDGRYRVDTSFTQSGTVSTEAGSYQITGYALDNGGNPYVHATVNLYDAAGETLLQTVYTSENGYYEFTNLEYADYVVEIIPEGDEGVYTTKETVSAQPGGAVIEGTVIDVNGDPIAGATVVVSGEGGDWSMTTTDNGEYRFEVPAAGDYTVTITYPDSTVVTTDGSYQPDPDDPTAPVLNADNFTISGYVHDTDGKVISGATVILQNKNGDQIDETTTDGNGYYEFTNVRPGQYTVIVISGENRQKYDVDTGDAGDPDEPNPPDPQDSITVSGTVVTDHKKPLAGAAIIVRNLDTGAEVTLTADADGRFDTGEMDLGRYEIVASYTHKYGTNSSDPLHTTTSQKDAVLVITLSYVADVNGDGNDETVYAGKDDTFDTEDDFYQADTNDDGIKEDVYAGEDKTPGTEDDFYLSDPDKDGEDEKVFVDVDRIPGTEDDYYLSDPDKDGEDEKVTAGEDETIGTKDDYYHSDPDGDGEDEQVFVGDDTKPGTEDDWYLDDDGNPVYLGVTVTFNGNGGTVNGKSTISVAKDSITTLPTASRDNYTFDGWYTAASGGNKLSLGDIAALEVNTTVYAHWTESTGGNPGGGSGGGGGSTGGGGGGGAGGDTETPTDPTEPTDPTTPPETILTDDHIAYVSGYEDGTVRPEANITRAEVAMIFYRLLSDDARSQYEMTVESYSDVASGAWYATAVATLSNAGILSGYEDGTFRPDATITRAEFATIAARFDTNDTAGSGSFTDIAGHWAEQYIKRAYTLGWVNGYSDGSFHPDADITRAEAVTLINRVLGRDSLTADSLLDGMTEWPDNPTSAWYYLAMQEATNGHDCEMVDNVEVWTALK